MSLRQSFAYQNFAGNPIQEFFERAAMASSLPPSKCLIFPVLRCRFSNQSKQHLLGKQKRKACSCITHKPGQFIKINKSQIKKKNNNNLFQSSNWQILVSGAWAAWSRSFLPSRPNLVGVGSVTSEFRSHLKKWRLRNTVYSQFNLKMLQVKNLKRRRAESTANPSSNTWGMKPPIATRLPSCGSSIRGRSRDRKLWSDPDKGAYNVRRQVDRP